MEKILREIAKKGNEERFNAICNVLNGLGIPYSVQKTENKYLTPIYDVEEKLSSFEMEEDIEEDDLRIFVEEIADDFGIALTMDLEMFYYEMIAEEAASFDVILPEYEEFKKQFCSQEEISIPKIVGYEENVNITKNIIVSLKNLCSDKNAKKIVFIAHYDAVPQSTGANDNGTGVTILISFIKEVMARKVTDKWFEIVFEDQEECGGVGAKNYIKEYGDEIGEVINLDTCGVGDNVIIANKSLHPVKGTSVLISDETIRKHEVIVYPQLPYCDSNVFSHAGYQVLTICTLPIEEDNDDLLSKSPLFMKGIASVGKYMHNGKRDSIEWIRYDTMQKILNYILILV